ncbi:superoxide oxidase [Azospirillaceae bacterium]
MTVACNTPRTTYPLLIQIIHWITALAVIAAWCLALVVDDMPKGPERIQLIMIHKSIGVSVLALTMIRLVARHIMPLPPLPATMPKLMVFAALSVHALLYFLLLALPIVGIIMSWSAGRPVALWGLTLPTLMGPDKGLNEIMKETHEILANGILGLAFLHVAASIYHQFWLKDGIMARILPCSNCRKNCSQSSATAE